MEWQVMGLFDTVSIRCPACEHTTEFQTKAGDCTMSNYEGEDVPAKIRDALDGTREWCSHCGKKITLRVVYRPKVVGVIEG